MDPVIEQIMIAPESVGQWQRMLCREPGFISMFHPQGRFLTARPDHSWRIPNNAEEARTTLTSAIAHHHSRSSAIQQRGFRGFFGGLAGMLDYELGAMTVAGLVPRQDKQLSDWGWIGAYSWSLFLPSGSGQARLLIAPDCPAGTKNWLHQIAASGASGDAERQPFRMLEPFQPATDRPHYLDSVKRILEYIHAGDCYQVNLSRLFTGRFEGSPLEGFQRLCHHIPVPYSAYIDAGKKQILSVSPECFLRIENGEVSSKPIKGTRPRGLSPEKDQRLLADLLEHPKDRAENLMIVDLIRNDLSRFCTPTSVRVPQMFQIESYENVHQLVSHVTGTLKPDMSPLEALLSAFPGGSITGAPKRRAMEIIDELEPHNRSAYCGSAFFWDLENNLDSNVAIRTLETDTEGNIHCWGGGGIVADSNPEAELAETEVKVRRLMELLESA